MKKTAIVLDFNPKLKIEKTSKHYDIYILDRYHDKIARVETSDDNELSNALLEEMTINEFYHIIAPHYKDLFCLFLSYHYSDIEDHLLTQNINQNRKKLEAKMFTYLINYKNQSKKAIIQNTLDMIDKEYAIKDVIVRIHKIRKKESFSLNDILMRYIFCLQ
ncbi:hypothetical protein KHQ81_13220 [Mycoplasmatota bacterium]|nr:hypothetical protein KHQ81_13220 [Mycoplasmatota bacterium]